ncbi:MAG: oxalurate catabolism protein HpxX [Enterobacteriaceae bacterium]|jgi:Asp-tRNA(Asn)/Glu-tRNA(Gln) amidotransferase C subunit|nr:oxalurate catabolism protein HpxX [Enterobacteriaceae bacterium]
MNNEPCEWDAYLTQMTQILNVELDDERRAELRLQFSRIAAMAEPLMAFPLDDRLEIAGVYKA